MSDASTKTLIAEYFEESESPLFLSSFFKSPPRNFHATEKVEVDIQRDDEAIAIVVTDIATGARMNENDIYTNKGFTPPIFNEMGAITAYNQLKRRPGHMPFEDPQAAAQAVDEAFAIGRKLERKIRRSIELMASQVFQEGVVTLTDAAGVSLYSLDFQAKTTHFPNAAVTWGADGTTGDPLADLSALGDTIRRDGKQAPDRLVFGKTAWQRFIRNARVKEVLDNLRMNFGEIKPEMRGGGASYRGKIVIDHYEYEMWMYDGYFKHPVSGVLTPYVGANKVIMAASSGRLDLSFGAIPRIVPPEQRAMPFLPERMSSSSRGLDLSTYAWVTQNGSSVMVEVGTRPLTIPTAIDTFGCLDCTIDS